MKSNRLFFIFFLAVTLIALTGIPTKSQFTLQTNGTGLLIGRNVNMVSGTEFIGGDPYLQRQNEPSIAVSTRNPMHLLAGANDYRTIDMPFQDKLPGLPEGTAARDAWLGVFKSVDGGESWMSTLLPGFPQDNTTEGKTSPIYGYDAACDPMVRAGTNGLFYYSGIAFNRADRGAGVVFVARYVDNNNIEDPSTIEYIDTNIVDQGNAGQFLDMPSIAVDLPRGLTSTQTVRTASGLLQDIPCGNVYIAYSVFLGNTVENVRSRILFARSTDCGLTWSNPIKLSESQHIIQRPKIVIDPSDPTGGTIYVAFRRFAHGNNPDAIVIVKSTDGGQTFSKPLDVRPFNPFDQGTSHYSFRTNSYPTMAVDNYGIVYLAWSQRVGPLPDEEARIVLTTSSDGGQTWLDPWVLDVVEGPGHQFMPSMTFTGGKLMLVWYDQLFDIAIEGGPLHFTNFIEDSLCRHTIDVRVAQAEPGSYPQFGPPKRVTRYLHTLKTNASGEPIIGPGGYWEIEQAQFNPPNYPLFQLGTVPFHGDWLEIASLMFLPTQGGGWTYNTDPSQASIFHATWTDNRDVVPPNGDWWGDWTNYTQWPLFNRPNNDFDPDACGNSQNTGMRNQNVYTSAITEGIIVGSPGNSKQLDLERTFVVFVKNTTAEERSFRLMIDEPSGVSASFKQFEDLEELDVTIGPYSTISRTVYASSSNRRASVRIDVVEIDAPGGDPIIIGGLEGYVVLNPDPTNPDALDPDYVPLDYEVHNPRVENPRVENYAVLDELNTNLINPRVENADLINSGYISPRVENPRVENPRVENLNILNMEMANPRVENPRVENAALVDVVWTVVNDGNTPSAYTFTLLSEEADQNGDFPGGLIEQVLIYKIHTTPAASALDGCELAEVHHDELVTVISNPRVENPRVENPRVENPRVENPRVENATVNLAPGEEALFVLRVYDEDITVGPTIEDVIGTEEDIEIGNAVTAHAVDTEDVMAGETTPTVAYSANYTPAIGYSPSFMTFSASEGGSNPAPQILQIDNTSEGILYYAISDDADWLDVSPDEGEVFAGDPANSHTVSVDISGLTEGTYNAEITIIGYGAINTPQTIPVSLTINAAAPSPGEWIVRHAGVGTSDDFAKDIVADAFGNIYVGGAVDGDLSGGGDTYDFITIKYNSLGNKVWEARYNGPEDKCDDISAMAIDAAGNIYVTGGADGGSATTHYNYATVKYDPSGTELWVARFVGPGASYDRPLDIAVDSSGNVYVTGISNSTGNEDFLTIKYDPDGNEEWQAWYNGPANNHDEVAALALDSSGNVYVTGWASDTTGGVNYATIKYNSITGNQEWARTYDGSASAADTPSDIVVDSSGNVYVTGRTDVTSGPTPGYEFAIGTVKYNSSGTEEWVEEFNFGGNNGGNAIALDSSGNVYVTGYSSVGPSPFTDDIITVKYNPAGAVQWFGIYDGPGHGDDAGKDIVVDSAGNVYVSGNSIGNGTVWDYTAIKYSSAGVEEWVRRYDGPSDSEDEPTYMSDRVSSMTLDALGHVCVTGRSLGSVTGLDIATVRYRPTLEEWVARYNGPGNDVDKAYALAVDLSGNVYVTGVSLESGIDVDYATVKYNSAGYQQWVARYNGPGNAGDTAYALAVDLSGNVYVTGQSMGSGTNVDYATIKYDTNGNELWVARYNGLGNNSDAAFAIDLDSSGNVYVTGTSLGSSTGMDYTTIKYDTNGNQLWVKSYNGGGNYFDRAEDLAIDSSDNVYVTGLSTGLATFGDYATIKYDSNGNQLWVKRYNGTANDSDWASAIAIDSFDNVYVTGYSPGSGTDKDYATIKYSSSGVELWVARYDGPASNHDEATAIAIDSSDNVYVTGLSTGLATFGDYATIKYDSNGNQLWVERHNSSSNGGDSASAIAIDSSDNVYVTGLSTGLATFGDYATIKYDSNGNQLWIFRYNGPGNELDGATALALDSFGKIYVTGWSKGSGTDDDYATIKYRKE